MSLRAPTGKFRGRWAPMFHDIFKEILAQQIENKKSETTGESDTTKEDSPSTSSFRIRDVSEINAVANSDEQNNSTEESALESAPKRKLSGQELQVEEPEPAASCSKRSKTSNDQEDGDGATDSKMNSSVNSENATAPMAHTPPLESEGAGCSSSGSGSNQVIIKTEPAEPENDTEAQPGISGIAAGEIKTEDSDPTEEAPKTVASSSGTTDAVPLKAAVKVEKADASSTSRESCRYGIRCYRRNPMHRIEESHPGDHDYKRPNFPTPPLGTPNCPFGNLCYRRNPVHFEQYSHPPHTNFLQNYKMHLRQRRARDAGGSNDCSDSENDYDLDDPFIDDDSEEYIPSEDESDDDDETLYTNSETIEN